MLATPDFHHGVVRILGVGGETAGTGFLAGESGLVVTCAHVVENALSRPGDTVQVAFNGNLVSASVEADWWRDSSQEDLCVLRPLAPWPAAATPLRLGNSLLIDGRPLSTFGFPHVKATEGMPGLCHLVGRTTENGFPVVQLRSDEISYGFSGAPVWSQEHGAVVGVVVSIIPVGADPAGRQANSAFCVPIEFVRILCKDLQIAGNCPYRGLEAFEREDHEIYYGRDAAIGELMSLLAGHGLVLVVGVSGSGKSSLLRAGLEKGLRSRMALGLSSAPPLLFKPTSDPLDALALELGLRDLVVADQTISRDSAQGRLIEGLKQTLLSTRPLIVVDQFERLFTDCKQEHLRRAFIALLVEIAGPLKVAVGMRADYYGRALQYVDFARAVKGSQLTLLPMSREELEEAIVRPAAGAGLAFEPGLVEQMIDDVEGRAGDLPLLQFALKALWEKDTGLGVLRGASYEALGYEDADGTKFSGLQGAVAKRAEEVLSRFNKADLETAKSVFLKLVVPNTRSAERTAVSRRAWKIEWDERTQRVIQILADNFLLVTGIDSNTDQPTVEIPHESLTRAWPRLRTWIDQYAPCLQWYDHDFVFYMQRWVESGKRSHLLLPKPILRQARQWASRCPELFEGTTREFIRKSLIKSRLPLLALCGFVLVFVVFNYSVFGIDHLIKKMSLERSLRTFVEGLSSEYALGKPIDSQYYLGWYQNFEFGSILYLSGLHPLSSGGKHEMAGATLLISRENQQGSDRNLWLLDTTQYQAMRRTAQFCHELSSSDNSRVRLLAFPRIPADRVHQDCVSLFRDGDSHNLGMNLGLTGSIARVYARYKLNEFLGKPTIYECQVSLIVATYTEGIALGGAPGDNCALSDGFFALRLDPASLAREERTKAGYYYKRAINPIGYSLFPVLNEKPLLDRLRDWWSGGEAG